MNPSPNPSSTAWTAGESGKADYLVGRGFDNEPMLATDTTAIGRTFVSFSPIDTANNPNVTNPASYPSQQLNSYPSQQLNSRFQADFTPSASTAAPAKPPPPPLPPVVHSSNVHGGKTLTSNSHQAVDAGNEECRGNDVKDLDGFVIGLSSPALAAVTTLQTFKYGDATKDDMNGNKKRARTSATNPNAVTIDTKARHLPRKKRKGAGIETPGPLDILRGRGGLTNHHPGNIKFRAEARTLRADYRNNTTTKAEKYEISKQLLMKVKKYGGKFLEKGRDNLWYEMDDNSARKKASQVLREEKWD